MDENGYTKMFVVNLANKVKEMRDAQKHYFSHNYNIRLQRCESR